MTRTGNRTRLGTRLGMGALALVLGLALAGCGEDESPDSATEPTSTPTSSDPTTEPTATPSPAEEEPTGPDCSEVWVAGEVLANNYNGCQDAEKGKFVQAMTYHCSSGQRLVTFRRNFYAAKGEVINESKTPLARDQEFKKVLASCGA